MALEYALYIKSGKEGWAFGTDGGVAGTFGQSRKTDAFQMRGLPVPVRYRIHVQGAGWLPWADQPAVTTGVGHRLEAIEFRFPGGKGPGQHLVGRAHLAGTGWTPLGLVEDGTVIGTTGQSRRLEAVQFVWMDAPELADRAEVARVLARLNEVYSKLAAKGLGFDAARKEFVAQVAVGTVVVTTFVATVVANVTNRVVDVLFDRVRAQLAKWRREGETIRALREFHPEFTDPIVADDGRGDLPGGDPDEVIG